MTGRGDAEGDAIMETRGLVRRASLLLSGEQPLPDLLKQLAELVAEAFDAGVGIEYAGEDGSTERHEYGARDGAATVVGVPAVFSEPFLEALCRLEGDSGAREVLERHASEVTRLRLPEAALDVDTPEDYRRLIAG